jgi:hypothetical protein
MLLHVEPDELIAAGHRMSEDGPALRALATLMSGCGGAARTAACGDSALDGALHALGERGAAVLTVLAAAAETLSVGLADSGRRYGDVEDRLAVLGRRVIG